MKPLLTAALVLIAACGGVLLGLAAPVLGERAANHPGPEDRVAHSE